MSAKISSSEISQAVLQHVEFKAYPESEQTASADLSQWNLPEILDAISKEREQVRVCVICSVCRFTLANIHRVD